jgi:curved DNA-binding protein CbpA
VPARHAIPLDDLYARLELTPDASFEAIEIAWRALLKRHHPDIAGEHNLEHAKRINVAHDWLSDPALRDRYDQERRPRAAAPRAGYEAAARARERPARTPTPQPVARRPLDPAQALTRFVERVARLNADERARLSVAEGPPIAFVASIRRFLSPDRIAALDAVEARIAAALGADAWASPPIRDAVLAAAHELVLREFLDEHLVEPFRGRVRDRLTRAWEAALGQPRYGPNTPAVRRLVERAGALTPDELTALVRAAGRRRLPADPWPRGIDPDEDEVFRVSSALAARDVADAAPLGGVDAAAAARARRILRRIAHAFVLRHAFTAAEFAALVAPWQTATGDPGTGRGARGRPDPAVRRSA